MNDEGNYMYYSETTLSDGRVIRYVFDEINGDMRYVIDDKKESVDNEEDTHNHK